MEEGISSHAHILNDSPARPTHTSTTKIRLSVALPFIAVHSQVYFTVYRVVLSPAVGHTLAVQTPPLALDALHSECRGRAENRGGLAGQYAAVGVRE